MKINKLNLISEAEEKKTTAYYNVAFKNLSKFS